MPAVVDDGTPLCESEAARLFAPLARHRLIALAVSGGGDSMALLHLYDRWRKACPQAPRAVVFTVDHGLRAEAADEAAMVARHCETLRIPHKTLRWQGPRPASGIQEAARAARYSLMIGEMAVLGADALVLAHTCDDQAETFLDRLARGSGVYGLAAMAPETRREGIVLARPLLDVSRARLRTMLVAAGIAWVDDPSNEDSHYRRVRMRRLLPVLEREGLGRDRLVATARSMARAAAALDGWVDGIIAGDVMRHPAGPCRFAASLLECLPDEVALRLVARLLRDTGGASHVPRLARLEAALADLGSNEGRRTLAGCVMERRDGEILVHREIGRAGLDELEIRPGETGIWDRRFAVTLSADAAGPVRITALGAGGLRRAGLAPPQGWPRAAFAGAPAARRGGDVLALPGFDLTPAAQWRGSVVARRIGILR
ncbi:tRNA(Ile)-lysidine synthase [Breoghania corrubedonensis]|uniref:tRNA(Ile)-lysidine synthase n=1 Tax=Breoghania corrubedonensis TaxID=665038 RepID=A0A2T5V7F1_9HYPH|nr:tRNA lysidine(34) synthetase TilS [Breoghania corrubedonensis]PTW59688.1 tRNA(Ile)-lysidine synthase [Breoghania corrubedonensis]